MRLPVLSLTPLEELLKQILAERPDIRSRIPTGDELAAYIAWMAETYSDKRLSPAQLPRFHINETQSMLAQRALSDPGDQQAFEQLSVGYAQQSEKRYILTSFDITVGRMIRYMPGQWHTSDFFEIYYAPCGDCPVHFEKETVTLSRGAVLIVAPHIAHASPCYADDAVLEYFLVRASTFERVFFSQLPGDSLLASFFRRALTGGEGASWLYFDTREDEELFRLAGRLEQEFQETGSYRVQLTNVLMTEFFIRTLMRYESTARLPRTEDFYWKHEYSAILSYIQKHYTDATLDDVARAFHYSSRQISRVVKSCFSLTYAQLVLKLKMERAAELLQQGGIPISEISRSLGYSDNSSFYHAFTRYYGKTPRSLR